MRAPYFSLALPLILAAAEWLVVPVSGSEYLPDLHLRAMLRGWDLQERPFEARRARFERSTTDGWPPRFLDHYIFDVRAGDQVFEFSALGINGAIDSFHLHPNPTTNPVTSAPVPSEGKVKQRVLAALKEIGVQNPAIEADLLYDPAKRFVEGRWTEGRLGFPGERGWFEIEPASGRFLKLTYPFDRPSSWAPLPEQRVPEGVAIARILEKMGQFVEYPDLRITFGPRLMWWRPLRNPDEESPLVYTSLSAAEYVQGNGGRARLVWFVSLGYWSRSWDVVADPSDGKVWEIEYRGEAFEGSARKAPLLGLGPAAMEVGFGGRSTIVSGGEFERTDAPKSFRSHATGWIRCAQFLSSFAYDSSQNRLRLGTGKAVWHARPNEALMRALAQRART